MSWLARFFSWMFRIPEQVPKPKASAKEQADDHNERVSKVMNVSHIKEATVTDQGEGKDTILR